VCSKKGEHSPSVVRQRCNREAEHVVGDFPKATMTESTDPKKLSGDERIEELARILARGIIRLVDAKSSGQESSRIRAQTSQNEP